MVLKGVVRGEFRMKICRMSWIEACRSFAGGMSMVPCCPGYVPPGGHGPPTLLIGLYFLDIDTLCIDTYLVGPNTNTPRMIK